MVISRDVTFNENNNQWDLLSNKSRELHQLIHLETIFQKLSTYHSENIITQPITEIAEVPDGNTLNSSIDQSNDDNNSITTEDLTCYPPTKRTSGRSSKPPSGFSPDAYVALMTRYALGITESDLPESFKAALTHPEREQWIEAAKTEMDDLHRGNVFELVTRTPDITPIPCRWVFNRKRDKYGNIIRHRGRVVAKGFKQRFGVDFYEIFSPVIRYTTVRIVFQMVNENEWRIIRIDVRRAFLYGLLDEVVYIEQPEGFIIPGKENWVYRLKKAIYGLRQSPRAWRTVLVKIFKALDVMPSPSDSSIFTVKGGDFIIIIIVYVDDILFTGNKMDKINDFISKVANKLEIRVEPEETKFVGFSINRDMERKTIKLHNSLMIEELLEKFRMTNATPCNAPIVSYANTEGNRLTAHPYRELIGSLMYLSTTCRPDITYATSYLSRFMDCATEQHWLMALHVLKYLTGTKNHGLIFQKGLNNIKGYSDADFGGDVTDRKSTSGYIFTLGGLVIS